MEFFTEKAKKIRLLILDVDGVLTSGSLFYGEDGEKIKKFHVHDGQGIKLLQDSGVVVAVITLRESQMVAKRMQDLGVTHLYQNQKNKITAYEDLKQKLKLTIDELKSERDAVKELGLIK